MSIVRTQYSCYCFKGQVGNQEVVIKALVFMHHKLVIIVLVFIATVFIGPLKKNPPSMVTNQAGDYCLGSVIQICEGNTLS